MDCDSFYLTIHDNNNNDSPTPSEKSVRKLSENFACYGDKLHEPEVYDFFLGILANGRKNSRPEAKAQLDELEAKIQENHDKGVEDENVLNKAANAKSKPRRPTKAGLKIRIVTVQSNSGFFKG